MPPKESRYLINCNDLGINDSIKIVTNSMSTYAYVDLIKAGHASYIVKAVRQRYSAKDITTDSREGLR